ncbi:MAG TPA: MBOAT family protein [Candidatus Mediterraneibacter avicola]|nr:MBOAT family protein [Candidatus Mediterraneibacter avicola]
MAYDSWLYGFVFLPVCLAVYQLAPKGWRRRVLLAFSYVFFYLLSGTLLVYLLGTTLLIHCIGVWLTWLKSEEKAALTDVRGSEKKAVKSAYQKQSRRVLALGVVILLGVLAYLKYYNFFAQNVTGAMETLNLPFSLEAKSLIMPIGISFYTLQAISYMADVYWGKIKAETNLEKTALFLAFFPQIMEGPIARYSDTADTLFAEKSLEIQNLQNGYLRIIWGLFKKRVIADRLAVAVAAVFDNYTSYSGAIVAVSAVAYTVQLYMEFSGCMDIIIGSGETFGIRLPENFRQPFCARNAAEFWRRWHITLGVWFKTYIFYPVSMSGPVKKWNQYGRKHAGKYLTMLGTSAMALLPVWLCNGLWHGSRWSYIFYGIYYFTLILLGIAVQPLRDKALAVCHINEDSAVWRRIQITKTWVIIFVGELFFRANGFRAGLHMFRSIFQDFDIRQLWDGTVQGLGIENSDIAVVVAGCLAVALIGMIKERGICVRERLSECRVPVRWCAYYALLVAVVIFAAYGDGYQAVDLIYAGF